MKKFKFELKAAVVIVLSGITGVVISRFDGVDSKDQFRVEGYDPINNKTVDDWFYERQLKAAPVVKKTPAKKRAVAKKAPLPKPSTGVK